MLPRHPTTCHTRQACRRYETLLERLLSEAKALSLPWPRLPQERLPLVRGSAVGIAACVEATDYLRADADRTLEQMDRLLVKTLAAGTMDVPGYAESVGH